MLFNILSTLTFAFSVATLITSQGDQGVSPVVFSDPSPGQIQLNSTAQGTANVDEVQQAEWSSAIPALKGVLNLVGQGERYIIRLHDSIDTDTLTNHIAWLENQLGTALPVGEILHKYNFGDGKFRGYAGNLHPIVIEVLRKLSVVHSVERDQEAALNAESTIIQTGTDWNLARLSNSYPFEIRPYTYQYWSRAGLNVDVYILDSGVSAQHEDVSSRLVQGINFSTDSSLDDTTGHGTHVSSTCCGTRWGVAKKASIVNVKVLNSLGKGTYSSIIQALNWVVTRMQTTKRTSIINLSVSGPVSEAINAALKSTVDAGVHVVVAAGNAGSDACNFSPSSAMKISGGIHVVGAVNDGGTLSSFSNGGSCVNILAPGEVIQAALYNTMSGSVYMSGTSMASPHVTGVSAVILSQVSMRPERLVSYIKATATRGALAVNRADTMSNLLWLNSTQVFAKDVLALTS